MSKSEQQSRCALPSTRRQFLKMTSAAAAVSSLSCWTQALAKTDLDVLGAKPAETLDKSVKVVNTYHEIHCHGQCMLKAHVKNGRLLALTSAGDVPRCEAAKTDESIGKMQRRACMHPGKARNGERTEEPRRKRPGSTGGEDGDSRGQKEDDLHARIETGKRRGDRCALPYGRGDARRSRCRYPGQHSRRVFGRSFTWSPQKHLAHPSKLIRLWRIDSRTLKGGKILFEARRFAFPDDRPRAHERNPVARIQPFLEVVADDDNRHARGSEVAYQAMERTPTRCIEPGGWFIEHERARSGREDARERNATRLPS